MSRIGPEQVRYVADLARLVLAEDEVAAMTRELDAVLEYAQALQAIDTEGIEPTSHPIPLHTPFREDRPDPPVDPEEALRNAPEREDTAFAVPKILDTDEV